MARTWILDTETKGTGARMVPLDEVTKRRAATERVLTGGKPSARPQPQQPVAPPTPRRFRVVDVMTRQPIADDVNAREAVATLKDVRSTMDVTVYMWQEHAERWRPLTLGEQGALWELAHPG